MSNNSITESSQFSDKLQNITDVVQDAAKSCQGNTTALLKLLRQLEQLHREIRDGTFQESLPNNRQHLYAMLKDIESEGGWPYIERMRLQAFLSNLLEIETEESKQQVSSDELLSDDRSWS
ncbi:hypothetical protein ACN23B_19360 [Anabaena sp. FACHB-709]|uniref:Uncharacterized protein n=2 Tax=Nostocaceae TaxID=1162 RepID=A0A1Z4KKH7_ANAVA|nr:MULTISPECIES: hypothetical protein [Nostocaceae]BAY69481.1 hypothetical protein NIES23_22750 [Trichormus variabilis NIES-23]HBW30091.1 hypothetical protein [Nostoc sp. UBA8866]MBD2171052.1 hypothetical protein [Anabaena cylindrica FACHB-318]MBD2262832.1 hypothetical protein [Anabaena sp. FACHB-709]MBD2272370.1 hypothetical protein [Nostoc sp. PCC 7120 = FACHB-418]